MKTNTLKKIIAAAILVPTIASAAVIGSYPSQGTAYDAAKAALVKQGCTSMKTTQTKPFTADLTGSVVRVNGSEFTVECLKYSTPPAPTPTVSPTNITWVAPTTRANGTAFSATEIKEFTLYISNGTTVTPVVVAPTVRKHSIVGLAKGNYTVTMTVTDTANVSSGSSRPVAFTVS